MQTTPYSVMRNPRIGRQINNNVDEMKNQGPSVIRLLDQTKRN